MVPLIVKYPPQQVPQGKVRPQHLGESGGGCGVIVDYWMVGVGLMVDY